MEEIDLKKMNVGKILTENGRDSDGNGRESDGEGRRLMKSK